jgi:hypothetical protein
VKEIVEKIIASALIYLPSSAKDFDNPSIDKYLAKYVRGSNNIDYRERIKIMKLLWDAVGTSSAAARALRDQLRRQSRGHPASGAVQFEEHRRLRPHDRARRCLHGRLRREGLGERHLAQSGRCRLSGCAGQAKAAE